MLDNKKARRRQNSNVAYIDALQANYSKLCAVRLDLSYKKPYSEEITLEEATKDLNRLLNNRRSKPSIFEHNIGYIVKKEYTEDKSIHLHAFFMFDGQKVLKDAFKADEIGNYWNENITNGKGTYYNCNKNSYPEHGIGMIDHTDMNGKADKERKIHIKSTSGHEIIFSDYQCKVKSPMVRSTSRYSGTGQRGYRDNDVYDRPNFQPNGKGMGEQVCIKIKSGFGQYMLFEDGSNQEKPTEQYIKISNAPGWNDPVNFLLMNQVVNKKLVHLNCAGERLTTVELNYTRVTVKDEILVSKEGNQIHVVEEQNMIDVANRKNIIQYAKLGDHIIFCRNGVHLTYALNSTMHLCLRNPHIILGEIPPDGEGKPPEGVAPVLLLGGDGPLPAHPAKYLIAN